MADRLKPENMPPKCRGCRYAKGTYVWQLCTKEKCTKAGQPRDQALKHKPVGG